MYLIGCSKADITGYKKGYGMLGYGLYHHTAESVKTPVSARAFVIGTTNDAPLFALVNCELCFITNALKIGVLEELKKRGANYSDETLMLTAQHTHSAPGGYAYYGMYNIVVPGFVEEVYTKIIHGIAEAITNAEKQLQPANIIYATGEFEDDKQVAFNRSHKQYNQNPEVTEKINKDTAHKGVNRSMELLRFVSQDGKELGSINWFGVHTTSVSNDLHGICYDNKGYAAHFLEEKKGGAYVGAFAQGTCGDVSPRFRYNPKRKFQRGYWDGAYEDDYESAAFNGKLQSEKAEALLHSKGKTLSSGLSSVLLHTDFSEIKCNPLFSKGSKEARTAPAAIGSAFLGGAYMDGPGVHPVGIKIINAIVTLRQTYRYIKAKVAGKSYKEKVALMSGVHGKKKIVLETHDHKFLGISNFKNPLIPGWIEPSIGLFKKFYAVDGYRSEKPWTAKVLPLQICLLGELALCAFPFEITTIAGKRLKSSLEERLKEKGIEHVILVPYANDYSAYITTNEEYQVQMYEGGHTVFGQWSLAALQTKMDELAQVIEEGKAKRIIENDPPKITLDELKSCTVEKS